MTDEPNPFIREYLDDYTKRVYQAHLGRVEEVAAAFISRHGFDPSDAEVVTHLNTKTMTWTTHIERSRRGQHPVPR